MRKLLVICVALAAACAPVSSPQNFPDTNPIPYDTVTPSPMAGPTGLIEAAESALPSPTPFPYKVRAGDTLGAIADRFNVSLDALLAANPKVSPNAMSVGDTLQIPSTPRNTTGQGTPTPAPFTVEQIACHPNAGGGLWCFALARNGSPDTLEDVTAQITLRDASGGLVSSQMALLPLDILPTGAALPLSAFFAPGTPVDARPQVQVLTAIRLTPNDPRYLAAAVQNAQARLDGSGLSAQVSGQVALPADSRGAASVSVAAVAYDGSNRAVGVRRWDASGGLQPGGSLPFAFILSSIAGEIERVEFAVEARP